MVTDADEQPDEEVHRVRSGAVSSAGASVPMELGHVTLCYMDVSQTWKLSEHWTFGIPWRHDRSLTQFSACFPSQENGDLAENSQLLVMVFLVTSLCPGAHPESLSGPKGAPGAFII